MNNNYNIIYRTVLCLAVWLTGTSVMLAGTETVVRTYDTSLLGFQTVNGQDGNRYQQVQWGDFNQTSKVGAPELPVEYIRFIVPMATNNFRVSVTNILTGTSRTLSDRIYPVQEPVPTSDIGVPEFTSPSSTAYNLNYPVKAEVVGDGFIDGCNHIVTVAVYPMSYNPGTGKTTTASSLKVTLNYDACSITDLESSPIIPQYKSRFFDVSRMVVNPSKALLPQYAPAAAPLEDIKDRYYIITPQKLEKSFDTLVKWKRQKGYEVVVKTIESIYNDPKYKIGGKILNTQAGKTEAIVDSAASLRAYLYDEYSKYGSYYCLLVGDWRTSMPIRRVHNSYSYNDHINSRSYDPTDNYFSDFTTPWTLINRYGGIYSSNQHHSYYPEIVIGRLLCYENQHVKNYVDKLMLYEAFPGKGDDDYLNNALYHYHEDALKESNHCFGKIEKVFNPFNTTTIVDSCSYGISSYPHTGSDVVKAMNNKGFITMFSHGTPVSFRTCNKDVKYIISMNSYTQKNELGPWVTNDSTDLKRGMDCLENRYHPGVLYTIACDINPFDDYMSIGTDATAHFTMPYNMAQSYTMAGEYGGVAFLGNTRNGWFESSTALEVLWCKQILINPKVGLAEALSKNLFVGEKSSDFDIVSRHHLIGDPEISMWLAKPKRMTTIFDFTDSYVKLSSTDLSDSKVVIYDGNNTKNTKLDNADQVYLMYRNIESEYVLSIWKNGSLPLVRLLTKGGSLTSSKSFIVLDGVVGTKLADGSSSYVVDNGGSLSLKVMQKLEVTDEVTIKNGGEIQLDCEGNVTLNCVVNNGGRLIVDAKNVFFGSKFRVDKGGFLIIKNK